MSLNKPLSYAGLGAAAIAISTSGMMCYSIESTRNELAVASDDLIDARKQAKGRAGAKACGRIEAACEIKAENKIGKTKMDVQEQASNLCAKIPSQTAEETCHQALSRGYIGSEQSTIQEYMKCIQKATYCYSSTQ